MTKFGPPRNQRNYITFQKVLIRAIEKCTFIELNLSYCVKSHGHLLLNFGCFHNAHAPKMVMSIDPDANFKNLHFVLILHLIIGNVPKFLVENSLLQKLSTKNLTSAPVPLRLRYSVPFRSYTETDTTILHQ